MLPEKEQIKQIETSNNDETGKTEKILEAERIALENLEKPKEEELTYTQKVEKARKFLNIPEDANKEQINAAANKKLTSSHRGYIGGEEDLPILEAQKLLLNNFEKENSSVKENPFKVLGLSRKLFEEDRKTFEEEVTKKIDFYRLRNRNEELEKAQKAYQEIVGKIESMTEPHEILGLS